MVGDDKFTVITTIPFIGIKLTYLISQSSIEKTSRVNLQVLTSKESFTKTRMTLNILQSLTSEYFIEFNSDSNEIRAIIRP